MEEAEDQEAHLVKTDGIVVKVEIMAVPVPAAHVEDRDGVVVKLAPVEMIAED